MLLDALFREDRLPGHGQPMPRPVMLALSATLFAFLAGSSINSTFTVVANTVKWLPLLATGIVGYMYLRRYRAPAVPTAVALTVGMVLLACTVSAFIADNHTRSIYTLSTVVLTIVTAYLLSAVVVASDSRRAFFDLVAVFCRVIVFGAAIFFALGLSLGRGTEFSAWVDNPNTLASMMAPGLIVMIARSIERRPGWFIWNLPFLVVGLPLLWITNGRASVVWLLLSAATFLIYRRGPVLNTIIALAAAILLIAFWEPIKDWVVDYLQLDMSPYRETEVGPLSGREEVWRIGWNLFTQRPIFGYGIGQSVDLVSKESWRFVRMQGVHFHSSYIMVMVETGLFGLVPFIATLALSVARGLGDAARTRALPVTSWPNTALPVAIVIGAMGHALFESWLLNAGNMNNLLLWTCVWMIHHQAQVPVRAVRQPAQRAMVLARR